MESNWIKNVSYPHERFLTDEQMQCNRPCRNKLCYEMVRKLSLCPGCVKWKSEGTGIVSGNSTGKTEKQRTEKRPS